MNFGGTGGGQQQNIRPPNPYKQWENWDYCHSHGSDVDNNHTSATCGKPGPVHNPNASCTNIMGRSVARLHKTILPLLPAALHPINAPSSSSTLSNIYQCLLPSWRHSLAKTKPSCTVWRNATGQWHLPPANDHGHAGVSARPKNDDECQTVPTGHRKYADDADGPKAGGSTHVNEPLCPQSALLKHWGILTEAKNPYPVFPITKSKIFHTTLSETDTSNRDKYFPFPANGNHLKLSQPIIATE
jgi:hypothetical protein